VTFIYSFLIEIFPAIDPLVPDYQNGYVVSSLFFGSFNMIPSIVVALFVKENPKISSEEGTKIVGFKNNFAQFFGVLKNFSFVMLACNYFLAWSMTCAIQNNLFLWIKYVIKKDLYFMWIILCIQLSAAFGALIWSQMAHYIGKKYTYILATYLWCVVMIFLYFVGDTTPIAVIYIIGCAAGLCASISFILPWSMLPDVVEYDQHVNQFQREGAFYSLFILLQKIGLASALATSSILLEIQGYINPEHLTKQQIEDNYQPPSVVQFLRLWSSLIPCVGLALSTIFLYFYPLTKEKMLQITQKK